MSESGTHGISTQSTSFGKLRLDIALAVFGIVLTGILFIFSDKSARFREVIMGALAAIVVEELATIAVGFFAGGVLCLAIGHVRRRRLTRYYEMALTEVREQKTRWLWRKEDGRQRWESIRSLSCSHIANPPLCYAQDEAAGPQGVGPDFLRYALPTDCVIGTASTSSAWEDVVREIRDGTYDTCVCPLYETFERQRDVTFSAPLFYADVGLYVQAAFFDKYKLNGLRFVHAVGWLKECASVLRFASVTGELSAKLALKYAARPNGVVELRSYQHNVTDMINAVAQGYSGCNVAFFESFHADRTAAVRDGSVVNVLARKELLYPVGFVFRQGDYVLRNLVNLKITEARDNGRDLIAGMLSKHLAARFGEQAAQRQREYFVTEADIVISGMSG